MAGAEPQEIEYREIDPEDREEALAFLWSHEYTLRDSFPEGFVAKSPEAMEERLLRLRERLATSPERFHCLGAFAGGALVGSVYLEIWDIEGQDAAHVHGLWVAPEQRRRGIARELKARAEVWGRESGCALMDANVRVDNRSMIALNEDLGYQVVRYNFRKPL